MAAVPSLTRLCTLGRGATATVALASDRDTGGLFAIKSAELSLASQLQHEHRMLSGLNSPHIISCHGSYIANSQFHLLLELAPGGSLFDRIRSHSDSQFDEPSIRLYVKDILLGLSYLHSRAISHGDIKSQNILIGSDGRAKIADFGTAMQMGRTQDEKLGPLSGTPAFMAPEVARGEERGPEADIWALGCTVIEMATGNAPWHGILKEQDVLAAVYQIGFCSDSMPPIPDWLSDEGKDFLLNCLKRDPTERWSAENLLNHPFIRICDQTGLKRNSSSNSTFSPQSALDFGLVFHDSETDDEDGEMNSDAAERIGELASFGSESSVFDWGSSEDGWIEVRSSKCNAVENGECAESRDQIEFLDYEHNSDLLLSNLDLNFDGFLEKTSEEEDYCFLQSNFEFDVCKAIIINKAVNFGFDQFICLCSLCVFLFTCYYFVEESLLYTSEPFFICVNIIN